MNNRTNKCIAGFIIINLLLLISCEECGKNLFRLHSQKEAYIKKLKKSDTTLAHIWDSVGNTALTNPFLLHDSYAEVAIPTSIDASCFKINLQRGQKLSITISDTSSQGSVFSSLYIVDSFGVQHEILKPDTTRSFFEHITMHDHDFLLLIHPTVNYLNTYTVKIQKNPSLDWPVANSTYSDIGSFWGVDRDGGARRHEGIDIFVPRGTDVLAVADGTIRRTGKNNLGGKIIFLTPNHMEASVYYAHLDSQYVEQWQKVKKGDVIGAVGNTGNAANTPPHLHFGIYTMTGPVNPLLFIRKQTQVTLPENISAKNVIAMGVNNLVYYVAPNTKSKRNISHHSDTFYLKGITDDFFRIENNKGETGFAPIRNWRTRFNN